MHERIFWRHFFDLIALGGALSEAIVVWWLLRTAGFRPDVLALLPLVAVLAIANRLAARRLEREPARGLLAGPTGHVVMAAAVAGCAGAIALGGTAAAYGAARWVLGLPAEAVVVGGHASASALGVEFQILASIALGLSVGAVAYGYTVGYRQLAVREVDVPIAGLPPALVGFRIVQLSDLHLGPIADRAALRDAFARAVALAPDLVCVTGDIMDSPATDLDAWAPELARVTAKHGVLAILGNHDRVIGLDRVHAALRRHTPWTILRDDVATIAVDGTRLHVVGLEERSDGGAAEHVADLVDRVPAGEPVVVLAHQPSLFAAIAASGADLVLSGHTHAGQIAMPGIPKLNLARIFMTRFDAGTFEHEGVVLHVNGGLGASAQRMRIGAPREISVLRLVAA